jgi:uncharacterized delta-60 repeat protein
MRSKRGSGLRGRASIGGGLILLPVLIGACGDDPNTTAGGTGGTGGTAGSTGGSSSGGSTGLGGNAGSGGSGGATGKGGSAGAIDAGTGGRAGSAGAAGSAGTGGGDAGTGPQPQIVGISATGHDRFYGVAHDATGNIFATGQVADSTASTADYATVLAKFLPSGAKDPGFGTGGVVTYNAAVGTGGELARGIVVQSTGKIVVSASVEHAGGDPRDRDVALMRFTSAGVLDTTFGAGGVRILDLSSGEVTADGGTSDAGTTIVAESTWGLSVFPNDDLIVLGSRKAEGRTDTDFAMVKLKSDGTTDATFATSGMFTLDINNAGASPRTATILPDGSVVGSGYMNTGGVQMPVIWKLTPAGALDTSFGVNGVFSQPVLAAATEAYGAALQGTSFVTAGYGRANTSESLDFVSIRLTPAGALDTTYGTNGVTRIDAGGFADNSRGLAVLPDNRVLLIGGGRATANNVDCMAAVLTPNGQPDTTFGPAGFRLYDLGGNNDFFWAASVAPDKKSVVIAGLKSGTPANDAGTVGNDDAALLILPLLP